MAQQPSGWGSTQNAANLPVVDAFARNLLMKYGGRTDDVWAFHDMPGYKQEIGGARGVIGGDGGSFSTGSGSVRISGMGRGGTPSDPGGYNWRTLSSTVSNAGQIGKEAFNFLADRRISNQGGSPLNDDGFRFGGTPIYNKYRGKQQAIARTNAINARRQERELKTQAETQKTNQLTGIRDVAKRAQETSQMLQPPVQGPPSPGSRVPTSSPVRRPRFNAEVNLLTTNRFPSIDNGTKSLTPQDIWATEPIDDGSPTFGTAQPSGNFWSRLSPMSAQQGESEMVNKSQPTSSRTTGAAGASQRPNQPRNRGRGPRNRGFGKRL